jgi:DNA polymerase I
VRAGLATYTDPNGRPAEIVLCLHDELLVHVAEQHAPAVAELVNRTLEQTATRWATGMGVRLVADISIVRRWSDAK